MYDKCIQTPSCCRLGSPRSGNANGYVDAVDQAVEALGGAVTSGDICPHVLAYIRAKMWVGGSLTTVVDRKNNAVASGTGAGSVGKNVTDANFNGQASLDFAPINGVSGSGSPFQMGPGLRLNGTQAGPAASFTVAASVRWSAAPTSGVGNLFGSTDGIWGYFDNSGQLNFRADGTHATQTTPLLTLNAAAVVWWSWDNAASLLRASVNNTTIAFSATNAGTHTPSGSGKIQPYRLSLNGGNSFAGQSEGLLYLDKAYMNGAVAADDALFTTLISTWAALI